MAQSRRRRRSHTLPLLVPLRLSALDLPDWELDDFDARSMQCWRLLGVVPPCPALARDLTALALPAPAPPRPRRS